MVNDISPAVRRIVAERMSPEDVALLIDDEDWLVRYTVALKVELASLKKLVNDPEADVREVAQQRLNSKTQSEENND